MMLVTVYCVSLCFFFKQKTAYEMRISDWSSDVCSSDLFAAPTPAWSSTQLRPIADSGRGGRFRGDAGGAANGGGAARGLRRSVRPHRRRRSAFGAFRALFGRRRAGLRRRLRHLLVPRGEIFKRKTVVSGKGCSVRVSFGGALN